MSRIVRFHQLGGPEVLKIEERPVPEPGPREVLVKVSAIGLNRADVMFRTGQYLAQAILPSQLGFEATGTVVCSGQNATRFTAGDVVNVLPGFDLGRYGTYAEHIVMPEEFLLPQPAGLSNVEGSALWMAYLTAFGGLIEAGRLLADQWVVVSAASSSVGLAAIQVARQVGARPIATTSSSDKREALLEAGAVDVIATREESLKERLLDISGGGVQCAFDAVGGPAVTDLADAMRPGGTLVIHGALSPEGTPFPLKVALKKSLTFRGFVYTEVTQNPITLARAQDFISAGARAGFLRPQIDKVFPLSDVVGAHRYLESNRQFGKIVMSV
ncbi:zinc-dependent alcohol dehydrogenase family protein [Paraburkholderia flagellata]|uniref:zinc-dependent alcohol dehydrogenase family protein n=1 Tax=Paraburkholderia flagellata TaxID=2883241 RepID=UPI001F40F5E6|nr:zinc-dependent alcohol dehydrogenase family protein [Paraburkholderia flagellata]